MALVLAEYQKWVGGARLTIGQSAGATTTTSDHHPSPKREKVDS